MSVLRMPPRRHSLRGRGHPVFRTLTYVVAALLGFGGVGGYYYLASAVSHITTVNNEPLLGADRPAVPIVPKDSSKGEAINVLLMGSDSRAGANAAIGGSVGGMRNDTTIIMHISADRSRIEFVSIPRDSWVRIPDCTLFDGSTVKGWTTKFNVAFSNGGKNGDPAEAAACVQKSVETLTGIYIHYYAVVDFVGFAAMIDALGGVPMCVPGHIVSGKAGLDLLPGPQIMNGETALAWARLRTAEVGKEWVEGSDIQRIARQQELLAHTAELALSKNLFTNQGQLRNFITAGADSMTTSPRLADATFLIGLAFSLRKISSDNIVFATVPNKYTSDFLNVVWTADANTMFDDIIHDRAISGTSVTDQSDAAPAPSPTGTETLTPQGGTPTTPSSGIDLLGACGP
jgi:LCP family protein required for cell wall assembly